MICVGAEVHGEAVLNVLVARRGVLLCNDR
jgi:hypothetical protein